MLTVMENIVNLITITGMMVLIYFVLVLREDVKKMSAELDRLSQEVSENNSAIDSAIVLINGLAAQIRDLADDPAALSALADSLDAKANELAAAVAANTTP